MGSGWLAARARARLVVSVIGVAAVVGILAAAAPGGVARPGSPDRGAAVAQAGYTDPAWSRDGRIAFVRRVSGADVSALWVMSADGSGARPILTGRELNLNDWSPDGTRLTFSDGNTLYDVGADGTGKRQLPSQFKLGSAWSPDGTRVAYADIAGNETHIFVSAPDGSNARDLGYVGRTPITWSPDGSKLAYNASDPSCHCTNEFDIARSDGSGVEGRITGSTVLDPAWSPDGSAIAFTAITTGYVKSVWIAGYPITGAPHVLSSTETSLVAIGNGTPGNIDHPRWSPDSRRIVFTRTPNLTRAQAICLKTNPRCPVHTNDLYVVSRDGSGLKNITYGIATKSKPAHCLPTSGDFASVSSHAAMQLCFLTAAGVLHGRKLTISGRLGPSGAQIPPAVRANLDTMSGYPTVWRIAVRNDGTFAASRSLTKAQVRNLRTFQNRVRLAAGTFGSIYNRTSTTVRVRRK
jgi:hypothetical protein